MAKNCVKLERLFQEVADLPDADELMTYVDRWVCIPTASTKMSDRHLNQGVSSCSATSEQEPRSVSPATERPAKRPSAAEPVPGYDSDSGLHRTEFDLGS